MIELFETRITSKAKALVNQVLDSGFLNQGKMVEELEQILVYEWGLKYPVTLNSCTASLQLALILSGVKAGDEVILPAQTFVATGLAVLMVGAKPVFGDVDANGNLDYHDVEKKITDKTKAVIVVHWGGNLANLSGLASVCQRHNLKLIEDAAHAFGATTNYGRTGNCQYSDFCCFSLQAIKLLTAADGGILCCKSKEDSDRAKRLRWFGLDKKNIKRNELGEREMNITELSYKMHMNDYNGALALGNLEGLDKALERRKEIVLRYYKAFEKLPIRVCNIKCVSSNWLCVLRAQRRNELVKHLARNFIQAGKVDGRIDTIPLFLPYYDESNTGQTLFDLEQLSIPCTSKMSDEDVQRVINTIQDFYE